MNFDHVAEVFNQYIATSAEFLIVRFHLVLLAFIGGLISAYFSLIGRDRRKRTKNTFFAKAKFYLFSSFIGTIFALMHMANDTTISSVLAFQLGFTAWDALKKGTIQQVDKTPFPEKATN